MIAITSTAALKISHWMALSLIRHGMPPPNSGRLSATMSCDELFSIPLPPQGLVVGSTTQKGVSKMSYREVKAAPKSGAFRQFSFLEAAFDQRPADRELREWRQLGSGQQRREELRIPGALQKEADVAGSHRISRQPYDAGEQRHHHLGVLAGGRDPQVVDRRHQDEARTQDGVRKLAHHQAADLAGRMNPLAVGKAVQAGVVAILGQAVIGRKASRRKGRKVLADAFGVLLPLALDRPPGPVRLFHRQKAHDQPGVNEKFMPVFYRQR